MEIQLADDVRAELMRLLHEERDKDRALLERLVAHLTVPPRSTWRVVELAGDGTPHDVPLEFPAQVVYIDNGSTKSVQVRAPGDIAPSPPIAASGQGRWLIPGATQVTVTGSGTGQVRLRFLNDASARLLADNPPGGSTTSPVYATLTGTSPVQATLTGSLVPRYTVDTLLVDDTTITVAAGSQYNSATVDLHGLNWAVAAVAGVTGTSLNYAISLYSFPPKTFALGYLSALMQGGASGLSGNAAVTTNGTGLGVGSQMPTAACYARVTNSNTSDSLTFTYLEVVGG